MAESDWFVLKRDVEIIDMILAVGFLICLSGYLPAIPKAKFGEA